MVLLFLVTLPVDCRVELFFYFCVWLCFCCFIFLLKSTFSVLHRVIMQVCSTNSDCQSLAPKCKVVDLWHLWMKEIGTPNAQLAPTGSGLSAHYSPMSWLPIVTNWSSGARFLWFFMALQEKIKSLRNAAKDQPISPNLCPQNPSLDNKVEECQWNIFFNPTATNLQLMPIAP